MAAIPNEVARSAVVSLDALIQQAALSPDANRVAVARSAIAALNRTLPADGDLKRSWIIYYLLAPLQGAALAPLLYLLLTSAVLSPQYASGAGTESLNRTAIYAFAGLTGLFAKQAIEKLADVFATSFAKIQARDTTRTEAAGG